MSKLYNKSKVNIYVLVINNKNYSIINSNKNIILENYKKLVSDGNLEKNENQIKLINQLDELRYNLEKNEKLLDELNHNMITFWDKPKSKNVIKNKKGFFNKFFNFNSNNIEESLNVDINGNKIEIRSIEQFKEYEKMLDSYKIELNNIKSLYIYGSPGSGKTFLMDMFFNEVKIKRKKRSHFNEFMLEVHQDLHKLKENITYKQSNMDPLYILATEMAKDINLLCFDEFQVTDIADAVILKRLFEILYKNCVFTVATSNRHPDRLYLQGLQRHLFIPFIEELKEKCKIFNISAKDFRIRHDIVSNKYLYPKELNDSILLVKKLSKEDKKEAHMYGINPEGHGYIYEKSYGNLYIINKKIHNEFKKIFEILTEGIIPESKVFEVMQGRTITCKKYCKGVGYFHFHDLCETAVGPADYIAIAQNCSTVLLEGIPKFSITNNRNSLRRFINLVRI